MCPITEADQPGIGGRRTVPLLFSFRSSNNAAHTPNRAPAPFISNKVSYLHPVAHCMACVVNVSHRLALRLGTHTRWRCAACAQSTHLLTSKPCSRFQPPPPAAPCRTPPRCREPLRRAACRPFLGTRAANAKAASPVCQPASHPSIHLHTRTHAVLAQGQSDSRFPPLYVWRWQHLSFSPIRPIYRRLSCQGVYIVPMRFFVWVCGNHGLAAKAC